LRLRNTTVRVDQYTVPAPSNQKAGNFPLGQCINDTTTPIPNTTLVGCWRAIFRAEPSHTEKEGPLDSGDSRVLSTTFADGKLWGTLDTGVRVGGQTKAGILFYVIEPEVENSRVRAELNRQGHIAMPKNNAIYGAVATTHTGRAIVGFTLVGDNHFPSAAYVSLNGSTGPANIHIIANGVGPQDGFSEYNAYASSGTPRPRWGDYAAAVATNDNTIWVANEYIAQTCTLQQYMTNSAAAPFGSCGFTRDTLGNWATRITSIDVSSRGRGDDDN
jgi:hypothetical protein